ncbi:MAG: hypothetical protein ACRDJ5_05805, partial [Actinomycetota bacterium]
MLYASALAAAATALVVALLAQGFGLSDPFVVLCLAVVAAFAERGTVRLSATMEVSISVVPTLFAAVLFGPVAAMIVAAASMLPDLRAPNDQAYLRWAVYTASRSITGGIAGLVAAGADSLVASQLGSIVLATIVAALVSESFSLVFAAATVSVRRTSRFVDVIRSFGPMVYASIPLYAPIVAMLVLAYRDVSPWT